MKGGRVGETVIHHGSALEYASQELQVDLEVVVETVIQHGSALEGEEAGEERTGAEEGWTRGGGGGEADGTQRFPAACGATSSQMASNVQEALLALVTSSHGGDCEHAPWCTQKTKPQDCAESGTGGNTIDVSIAAGAVHVALQ